MEDSLRTQFPVVNQKGLFHEPKIGRGDGGLRGREDQHTLGRGVAQARPGRLDLDQLAQAVGPKSINRAFVICLGWVHSELAVETLPGES